MSKSLDYSTDPKTNLDGIYALALLLAETRDINGAIRTVKRTLAAVEENDAGGGKDLATESMRRKMAPFWHLLALLLTVKGEFESATDACEAALDRLQGPADDSAELGTNGSSYTDGNDEKSYDDYSKNLESLEGLDKITLVQVKMTDLALIEVLDDPTAAVDATNELLALYAVLFGDPKAGHVKIQESAAEDRRPKSSYTFRQSILGRVRTSNEKQPTLNEKTPLTPSPTNTRPPTRATETTTTPTIQVTNEHGSGRRGRHSFSSLKNKARGRTSSQRSPSVRLSKSRPTSFIESSRERSAPPAVEGKNPATKSPTSRPDTATTTTSVQASGRPDFRPIAHNIPHEKQVPPAGHSDQPPRQDMRLPVSYPSPELNSTTFLPPKFPSAQERKQHISLLIDVWLFIAGFYIRASLFEDGKGAIDEAANLVTGLEAEIAQLDSSARAFASDSWSSIGKSVEQVWADVYSTVSLICETPISVTLETSADMLFLARYFAARAARKPCRP